MSDKCHGGSKTGRAGGGREGRLYCVPGTTLSPFQESCHWNRVQESQPPCTRQGASSFFQEGVGGSGRTTAEDHAEGTPTFVPSGNYVSRMGAAHGPQISGVTVLHRDTSRGSLRLPDKSEYGEQVYPKLGEEGWVEEICFGA